MGGLGFLGVMVGYFMISDFQGLGLLGRGVSGSWGEVSVQRFSIKRLRLRRFGPSGAASSVGYLLQDKRFFLASGLSTYSKYRCTR